MKVVVTLLKDKFEESEVGRMRLHVEVLSTAELLLGTSELGVIVSATLVFFWQFFSKRKKGWEQSRHSTAFDEDKVQLRQLAGHLKQAFSMEAL